MTTERQRRSSSLAVLAAVGLATLIVVSCGGNQPASVTSPVAIATPAAVAPDQRDVPPVGSSCGMPYPPAIHQFRAMVRLTDRDSELLESLALVGPNAAYCAAIGYTDGRSFCPVRMYGSPDRDACERWRVGNAKDTGRSGPTWTRNGKYCTGPESGCANHPENQYLLIAYAAGTYEVCGEDGACGKVVVER